MVIDDLTDLNGDHTARVSVDISVLVPTRNESRNVALLTSRLNQAMAGLDRTWELLFIDDSDDTTPDVIRRIQNFNSRVSMLHRGKGERSGGLGSAVVAGIAAARGQVIVIMDGDLQHPPKIVRELSTAVLTGKYDVAIASRYVHGASNAGLDGFKRRLVSRLSVAVAHLLIPETRKVRDPMSGFFAISRTSVTSRHLRPHGFKILMEILARGDNLRVAEVPFQMDLRQSGESKTSAKEGFRFIRHAFRIIRSRWSTSAFLKRIALQLPLLGILAVQTVLTLRLVFNNTAFIDEATYLSAGHYELHVLLHGGPNLYFPTYFSGAPTIYPILGSLANNLGGLHAARLMNLGFMILATLLCFHTTRRLWGRPAGWFAAAIFVTVEGTQFLGALATYDAMSLMLIALAAWIVVRTSTSFKSSNLILLAAPILVFANATKYASTIFDPIVFLLAFFVILQYRGLRSSLRTIVALIATFGVMLAGLLAFAPTTYLQGISSTTLNRANSNVAVDTVLRDAWSWVGAIFCIAIFATAVALILAWKRKADWAVVGIIGALAIAVLLAPANEARIHTTTSLFKHVTFGAWFGAVAAGWLVHVATKLDHKNIWIYGKNVMLSMILVLGLIPLLIVGTEQAEASHNDWWNSTSVVKELRPLLKNLRRPVLMDYASVAEYYLQDELPLPYWHDQYYFSFVPTGSTRRITGLPALKAAIEEGWFGVIALDWANKRQDNLVSADIGESNRYVWVGNFPSSSSTTEQTTYVIWRIKNRKE